MTRSDRHDELCQFLDVGVLNIVGLQCTIELEYILFVRAAGPCAAVDLFGDLVIAGDAKKMFVARSSYIGQSVLDPAISKFNNRLQLLIATFFGRWCMNPAAARKSALPH